MNVAFVTRDGVLAHPKFDHVLAGCTSLRLLELAESLREQELLKAIDVRDVTVAEARASRDGRPKAGSATVTPKPLPSP